MLKLIWVNRLPRFSVALYLFLGWTIVVAFEPLLASVEVVPLCWTAWRRR
jgi:predicted membrane channel-forming protein YqfA (hemolysin III family)